MCLTAVCCVLTASSPFTADASQDVFDEHDQVSSPDQSEGVSSADRSSSMSVQLYMTHPRQTPAGTPGVRPGPPPGMPTAVTMPAPRTATPQQMGMEEIELRTPRADQSQHNI